MMDFSFSLIPAIATVLYLLLKLCSWARYYIHGRRSGFPVIVSPAPTKSAPWLLLGPVLHPVFKRYLPEWIFWRVDISINGWEYRRRTEIHDRLGKVFALVTPDECSLWVADPVLGNAILQRRKDFGQPPVVGQIIGFLGPNVISANGDDWQRQRRLVAPNLNERISQSVWNESCEQAQIMLQYLEKNPGDQTLFGLRTIAINVLGQAGYGQTERWSPEANGTEIDPNQDLKSGRAAYFIMTTLIADLFLQAAFLPTKLLKMPFMSPKQQLLGRYLENAPRFTKEILNEERQALREKSTPRNSFLSMLVHQSDKETSSGSTGLSLSEHEIQGNLFILSTAGYESTGNTMGYAVILLSAYPEWQMWVRDELQHLDAEASKWKYEEVFTKCPRTLAVMLETLRHFTPILHSTRYITEPQQVADSNGTHLLMPPMEVYVSAHTIHHDPEIWGHDVDDFRPSRWIDNAGQVITPPKGTFLPWSGGPRVCPGMKMSQVEFVATLATLFRSARCEPLQLGKESVEQSRKRFRNMVFKESVSKLTLQVRDPKEVKLRWVRETL